MRATTPAIISVATALFVTACVMLEDRIARVTTPEIGLRLALGKNANLGDGL